VSHIGRRSSQATRVQKASARAEELPPIIGEIRVSGRTSPRQIAAALNERGVWTPEGRLWQPTQMERLLEQVG
jgi:hypothetical protein